MNYWLLIGGCLSLLAGVIHLVIIVKGTKWYKFFGAGEKLVKLSEKGSWIPGVVTFLIASVLIGWGFYAFSGVGIIAKLPYLHTVLVIIAITYLLRGFVVIPLFFMKNKQLEWFMVWSSMISLVFGTCYLFGLLSL